MTHILDAKRVVRRYQQAVASAPVDSLPSVLEGVIGPNYRWRGSWPFRELDGAKAAARTFWQPLATSLAHLKRREDIFIGGQNLYDDHLWVMSMGHFMGLFDEPFLGIPATGRIATLRYAEFSRIEDGAIAETGLFIDLIGLMAQAGVNPLPPSTGVHYHYPGPMTHDGIIETARPDSEAAITLAVLNRMVDELSALNESGSMEVKRSHLTGSWHEDMVWYGPAGIGATYTIDRYIEQHSMPFRSQLTDKRFEGHVCRFAEGDYACFFGWPNLSNTPMGGFLGLPSSRNASMQVVDVYRRSGDKLAENWVLIDLPWWLQQQGLDVLQRNRELTRHTST